MKQEIEDSINDSASAESSTASSQVLRSKVNCLKTEFGHDCKGPCGCDECRGEAFIKDEPHDSNEDDAQQEDAETEIDEEYEEVNRPIHSRASKKASVRKRPFVCSHCEKRFQNKCRLNEHLRIHTGERPFPCDQCPKRFACKNSLTIHIRRVHTHKHAISCNVCNYTCATKSDLKSHVRAHSDERQYPCDQCPSRFKTKANRRSHIRAIHSQCPMVSCPQCDKRYKSTSALRKHVRVAHSAGGGPRFSCPQCDFQTNFRCCLKKHLINLHTDERPFACGQCSRRFKQRDTLTRHVQLIHDRVRAYACDGCQYACFQKSILLIHQRMHTGERPYRCDQCSKRFISNGDLQKHIRRIHNGERSQSSQTGKGRKLNNQLESGQNEQQQQSTGQVTEKSSTIPNAQMTIRVKCIKQEEPEGRKAKKKKKVPCKCDECRGQQFIKEDPHENEDSQKMASAASHSVRTKKGGDE